MARRTSSASAYPRSYYNSTSSVSVPTPQISAGGSTYGTSQYSFSQYGGTEASSSYQSRYDPAAWPAHLDEPEAEEEVQSKNIMIKGVQLFRKFSASPNSSSETVERGEPLSRTKTSSTQKNYTKWDEMRLRMSTYLYWKKQALSRKKTSV